MFSDRRNVQCIDSEVALKLLYFLLPAEVMRCLVGECNVIPNCGCRYTRKGAVMLRLQAIFLVGVTQTVFRGNPYCSAVRGRVL